MSFFIGTVGKKIRVEGIERVLQKIKHTNNYNIRTAKQLNM